MREQIYNRRHSQLLSSFAISGVVTLELHALNNEGSEGNTMMTRMVDIVLTAKESGAAKKHSVNAVSGDMFKHILVEHLTEEAKRGGLSLSRGCELMNPNRIQYDWQDNPKGYAKDTLDSVILKDAISTCAVTDCAGTLITSDLGKTRSIARKSCVEFGWLIGKPGQVTTDSYFHAKYVAEGRGEGKGESANLGQNIFHRPASSGQYAAVLNVDLYRVGRNDISLDFAYDEDERKRRCSALIKSVISTFVKPIGAHRNTQAPHVVDFSGVIATSKSTVPAPCISPLNEDFATQLEGISATLNRINKDEPIKTQRFHNLNEFASQMADMAESVLN
jgi:CRISPR-associated protein Cst2